MKTILIDPGHGISTPGKASPDGMFREWEGNRQLARRIVKLGEIHGMDCRLLFDSDNDLSLTTRAKIANEFSPEHTILLSIHSNAAGNGTAWHEARGFSAFVGTRAGAQSRRLAYLMVDEAAAAGLTGNRSIPQCGYWVQNLAICNRTLCPAVLTENLFMDNPDDLALLRSAEGMESLAQVHVKALIRFMQ